MTSIRHEASPDQADSTDSLVEDNAEPVVADDQVNRTVASRSRVRAQLRRDVEQFLTRGGRINQIEPDVSADPPRKPVYQYGGRPI